MVAIRAEVMGEPLEILVAVMDEGSEMLMSQQT